jgi:hypothetical protein
MAGLVPGLVPGIHVVKGCIGLDSRPCSNPKKLLISKCFARNDVDGRDEPFGLYNGLFHWPFHRPLRLTALYILDIPPVASVAGREAALWAAFACITVLGNYGWHLLDLPAFIALLRWERGGGICKNNREIK